MKTSFEASRLMRALFEGLWLLLAWCAAAQPATYSYDPSGNPVAVTLGAAGAPAINSQPQPELIQSNSLATFSVSATGAGLSYQWFSNGVAIAGATGDSLTIANLAQVGINLGYFSVIVSNAGGSITSAPAALWPDANGNGIPDWWEMYYFGNLNQTASGDFDHDGVDNLHEYLEGTNPTNAASFNPRLVVESAHGTVTVTPLQPYYTLGQFVTLTAVPDPAHEFTEWSGSVSGTKPQLTVLMDTNKSIVATFGFPLALALDNTNLLWSTGGDALWFGQAEVSEDGVASAQSGPIVSFYSTSLSTFVGQQTWLETVADISQTMRLSFWWNVSSRSPDALNFAVDSALVASISGEAVGWQNVQTNLAPGRHTLTWTYTKGPVDTPTGVPFADSGWVDQVSLVATNLQVQPPLLSILLTATNSVVISWPAPSTGWTLQQNTNLLVPTAWASTTNPVSTAGGQNQVLVTLPTGTQFYRLQHP
ncbi:MAG TPA: hypothetical protein VNZ64_02825 [Candidatus Acidoferrum sp.]|nr:hypothetical protein [Candidatus Acidoferrum sp.]